MKLLQFLLAQSLPHSTAHHVFADFIIFFFFDCYESFPSSSFTHHIIVNSSLGDTQLSSRTLKLLCLVWHLSVCWWDK